MFFRVGYYYHSCLTGNAYTFLGWDRRRMLHFYSEFRSNHVRLFEDEATRIFEGSRPNFDQTYSKDRIDINLPIDV